MNNSATHTRRNLRGRCLASSCAAVALMVLGLLTSATSARADFQIEAFTGSVANQDGSPATQAGAHPFSANTTLRFSNTPAEAWCVPLCGPTTDEDIRDISIDLPPGFVGNPEAVPKCPQRVLFDLNGNLDCPPGTQVGLAKHTLSFPARWDSPIFNMEPPPGRAAQFAMNISGNVVTLDARLRTDGTYAISVDAKGISQLVGLSGTDVTLWGVPADPVHDFERQGCVSQFGGGTTGERCPAQVPIRAFLTNPTACSGPLTTSALVTAWNPAAAPQRASFNRDVNGIPMATERCDRVPFDPSIQIEPSTRQPDSPSGLRVRLAVPQDNIESPQAISSAHLKDVKVTLPEGMTINPGGANGLQACSDAQAKPRAGGSFDCPEASRIGEVEAKSPLLANALRGGVYVATQRSMEPESGEMFRLFIRLVDEERGIDVRLPGTLRVDSQTGRVETTFRDNPQLPVASLDLNLKSGSRAPLASPTTCGSKTTTVQMSSWSGHNVSRSETFDSGCTAEVGRFAPRLLAGSLNSKAGAFAPFRVGVTKPDGNVPLNGLRLDLPTGLLANLKGNVGRQVGSVKTYAGPGSDPFMLPGKVYLEGRYGDAPFSLRVVVPAKAGPFDLGEVVVRQKIYVNPKTAAVSIVSDPLPTIVKGVPVRLQRLEVAVDKPGFMINPSSCQTKAIGSRLHALDGQSVPINMRFQMSDCSSLSLSPKLALRLSGKGGLLKDGGHPGLKAVLTQKSRQANLQRVSVKLPLSLALDPNNAQGLCEYKDSLLTDPKCPKSSIVGSAQAYSPILNQRLAGPVYFAKNIRINKFGRQVRTLPNLVLPLRGENGLKLNLVANSSVSGGKLVNTFKSVPDAPVSYFSLALKGGKNGILVANSSVCKRSRVADVDIDGHNGKHADQDRTIKASCGRAEKKKSKTSRRR